MLMKGIDPALIDHRLTRSEQIEDLTSCPEFKAEEGRRMDKETQRERRRSAKRPLADVDYDDCPAEREHLGEFDCGSYQAKNNRLYIGNQAITDFDMWIIEHIETHMRDSTVRHSYLLGGKKADGTDLPPKKITAEECLNLPKWIINNYGFDLRFAKEHASKLWEAVYNLSKDFKVTITTENGGGQKVNGQPAYVTKDGAITREGFDDSIRIAGRSDHRKEMVSLPDPTQINPNTLKTCIEHALALLSISPTNSALGLLILLAPLRAIMSMFIRIDLSLMLVGRFATCKTSVAMLSRSFFNPKLNIEPTRWNSSEKAIYDLLRLQRHSTFVLDDFSFSDGNRHKYSRDAEKILQAAANGRAPDTKVNTSVIRKEILLNTLIVSTSNRMPKSFSDAVQSRVIALVVEPGDVPLVRLTRRQKYAEGGEYAKVMSAFIYHLLSDDPKALKKCIKSKQGKYRAIGRDDFKLDPRRADIFAGMMVAWDRFLKFAEKSLAIDKKEGDRLFYEGEALLAQLLIQQYKIFGKGTIRERFIDALTKAMSREPHREFALNIVDLKTGKYYVSGDGEVDEKPFDKGDMDPIHGYYDPDKLNLYMKADAYLDWFFSELQDEDYKPFKVGQKKFWKDMKSNGVIASHDSDGRTTVRRRLPGLRKEVAVYHVKIDLTDPYKIIVADD